MSSQSVLVPNVTLTLDQLLAAIQQLDEPARIQIARALLATEMDTKLSSLIARLAAREPTDDISDDVINAEISAMRQSKAEEAIDDLVEVQANDDSAWEQPICVQRRTSPCSSLPTRKSS